MARRLKGARLHWRNRDAEGKESTWEIRDESSRISTGTSSRQEAELLLSEYLSQKHRPAGPVGPHEMSISQCLTIYADEHATYVVDPPRIGYAIDALDRFWADQPTSIIAGNTCRKYANSRVTRFGKPASNGTIRRELSVLQAALNYCHGEGYLTSVPKVTLPPKPPARERWLTRQEAAWLLRGARNLRVDGRHLADFILHALYTGSRKVTILAMYINTPSLVGGHVDTVQGILYRKPRGKSETAKWQRPARIPPRYLAHLRRQAKRGRKYVVQDYRGNRVGEIKHSWSRARNLAMELARAKGIEFDLSDVTPHTLKHTAITWALQKGVSIWETAGYFSTSPETINRVYGHHSPDFLKGAIDALNRSK